MVASINGLDLIAMIDYGAKNLSNDVDRINALNVFPVPDGDTGSNMRMTISGGATEGKKLNIESVEEISAKMARAMTLSARGNSGVILSQFFKGFSMGAESKSTLTVKDFAGCLRSGTKKAYSVVQNPTEGTILTVMREAGDNAFAKLNNSMDLIEFLEIYINFAKTSLENTPNLLPVLKKAGVIDSGGAGFILIIEGMLKYLKGEELALNTAEAVVNTVNTSGFNADSELTYGYCTEFILQLQNSKVNPKEFDLKTITDYLESIDGNSVVAFKDEDIIKVHVHTFDPGLVLNEFRKYGEFLTIKIENMNVQHTESEAPMPSQDEENFEYTKYATVVVANGSGLEKSFKELGVNIVVSGGQTMNTSTQDFIDAFDKLNCDYILVYPNNGNIIMAANQAAKDYTKAKVVVIPTKSIAQGYSAISMLNLDSDDIDTIVNEENDAISNVNTLEVTYSVRDTNINDIEIKKGDYICIYNGQLISANKNRLAAVKTAFNNIENFEDFQVLTVICGKDVDTAEVEEITNEAVELNSYAEVYPVEGNQEVYSYIIGLE